ncbi:MAG: sarcosine oxidase subunit gamma [Rhodobacteraceae bacterium]|nr:sarcosine oxidase subunit gamma [Paracoccaceae bacterium]
MAELIAKSACDGLLPLSIGSVTVTEEVPEHLTGLAPFKGQAEALSAAMQATHGAAFPAPNRATGKAGSRAVWFGREMALLVGPAPDATLARHAALTDQSDAWAVARVEGDKAEDVLARLVPLDLRPEVFKRGHAARTQLQHLTVSINRLNDGAFQIMAFRSMAATLVHDLKTAMEAVAARG